ncbi:hypothetical protein ES703_14698 [subsurface metagenome]
MYKTVSSRLTALFNPDGGHLKRYLERKSVITKSFCEDLILHDQVLVPTQDYLTACGLILIIGEKGFIELLERDKLKFIRTRRVFGFVRGKGPDGGLAIFKDPNNQRPQDSPLEQSVHAGLSVIKDRIKEKKRLHEIIVQSSFSIEWATILDAVRRESIQDLKQTELWNPEYEYDKPDILALPGMKKMQARVIGPGHDPKRNIVDTLLALTLYNSDLYLAEKYKCQDTSPFYPVGDLLDIKEKRLLKSTGCSDKLWTLLEVNGVPDFSQIDLTQGLTLRAFLNVVTNKNAKDFRNWFHQNQELSEKEIVREYIGVLQRVPWIQRLPLKTLRFVVTSSAGLVPGLGQAISFFDSFIVDRLFSGRSPKFFIDDLTNIKGNLKL